MVLAADRSVYLTDHPYYYGSFLVRRIAPDGLLWTVAGCRTNCIESGEGIPATQALFGADDIALGPDGAVYISDYHINTTNSTYVSRILKVGSDGIIHTFAGAGAPGTTGDGGPATQAQIDRTYGIAFGPDGSLYLLSTGRVRKVDPSGTITTVAGNGSCSSSYGDGGPARLARFCASGKLAVGSDGSIYLPDTINRRLRKITPDGIIRTIAGTGAVNPSGDGGPAINAGFGYIYGIALGRDGSIFLGEDYSYGYYTHSRIRKIAPNGTISTISGGSPAGYAGDGGAAALAPMPIG